MDISIAVLVYKSEYKSVLATVMSVIKQSYNSFELVVSDDGSNAIDYDDLKETVETQWNGNLTILNNPDNVGTIQHCINVASVCSGKYIKLLGAGDLLHDSNSLQLMVDFMEHNQLKLGIGKLLGYTLSSDSAEFYSFRAPIYEKPYLNGDMKAIRRNLVYRKDYICGASMIFDRNYLIKTFRVLGSRLKYVEDLSEYLTIFDNERIMMLDKIIVYYEISSGISTNPTEGSRSIMKKDFIAFWDFITDYTDDPKEKNRFRGYSKIETLKKKDKFRRLVFCLMYDPWYFIFRVKRRLINGRRLECKGDAGFLDTPNIFITN